MKLCFAVRECCAILVLLTTSSFAETVSVSAQFDRWNYPFNATVGSRLSGSTFGAVGNPQFDDHDAQIILGFDTQAAGIPANAEVTTVSVLLTTASDNTFEYDPTYDTIASYLDSNADTDTGRPVELYGVGFRNGFLFPSFGTSSPGPIAFEEDEAFVLGNPAAEGVRNAFMSDYVTGPRDVSNNVADGIDLSPWAVGTIADLQPGATVPLNTEMRFDVDLSQPQVRDYLNRGIESGGLFFTVASMHTSTQGSGAGIPSFYLGDPNLPDLDLAVASVDIDYQVVPEPSIAMLLWLGMGCLVVTRRPR